MKLPQALLTGLLVSVFFFLPTQAHAASTSETAIAVDVATRNQTLDAAHYLTIQKYYTVGTYSVADVKEGNGQVINLMVYDSMSKKVSLLPWWNRLYWVDHAVSESIGAPLGSYGNAGDYWIQAFEGGTIIFKDYHTWLVKSFSMGDPYMFKQMTLDLYVTTSGAEMLSRPMPIQGCEPGNYMIFGRKNGETKAYTIAKNSDSVVAGSLTSTKALTRQIQTAQYDECFALTSTEGTLQGLGTVQLTTDGIIVANGQSYSIISYQDTAASTINFYNDVQTYLKSKKIAYTPLTYVFVKGNTQGYYAKASDGSLRFIKLNPEKRTYAVYTSNDMKNWRW